MFTLENSIDAERSTAIWIDLRNVMKHETLF